VTLRGAALGVAALLGALVAFWLFSESPRLLGELLFVVAVVVLVFFAGRGAWSKWRAQSPEVWSLSLLGSLGVAISGWIVAGAMALTVRAMGESYAMVIVAPLMLVFATLAGLVGLAAAIAGIAVIAGTLTRPTPNAALVLIGGVASIVLNLGYIWAMLRVFG